MGFVIAEFTQLVREAELPDASLEPLKTENAVARILSGELEYLLNETDPECWMFIDSLRLLPESEELILQIEDFDFKAAAETLAKLKKLWKLFSALLLK